MSADAGVLIIGAGAAAVQTAEALRTAGCTLPITLLGDEAHAPYHRPPLSKAWLAGEVDAAQLTMRSAEVLARKQIALRTDARVTAIDREQRRVMLVDGSSLPWQQLVIATGARPRHLTLPGADAPNVLPLRTRDEAAAIAAELDRCASAGQALAVVGGGFIGLEVAATARKKGVPVTVVEAAPRLLGRVLNPALSEWYAQLHRHHGVQLELAATLAGLDLGSDGRVQALRLADGRSIDAGLVVVGIGVQANDELARAAGLECDRGVVVDACARTADPAIVAAGDCTARRGADGSLLRLESVNNATEQGKSAAAALMGQERPFGGVPWFWSDQYDRKLQMAGIGTGTDSSAVRGTMGGADSGPFSVWHFRQGRLIAVDAVNSPRDHLMARKLLEAGRSPTPAQVQDTGFDLNSLLAAA